MVTFFGGADVSGIRIVVDPHMETPAKWSSNAQVVLEKPTYKKMMEIRDMVTNDELGDSTVLRGYPTV